MEETDTGAPVVPPEGATPPSRRTSRLGIAMVVVGTLFALAAIPVALIGIGARSDASAARDAAATAHRDARVQSAQRLHLARQRISLQRLVSSIPPKAQLLASSVLEVGEAQAQVVDVENRAAAAHNAGNLAGAVTTWQTDGKTAVDAVQSKDATAHQQLEDAQ